MRVKLMFVWLMITTIGLVLSCSKEESSPEPEIKLNPFSFEISAKSVGYNVAEIQWTASLISDKSKIVYDVYLNDELKGSDLEVLSYQFEDLTAVTTYNLEVIAKSIYETQVVVSYSITTIDTPVPGAISLKSEELTTDQIKVSWVNSDPVQKLTYAIYLDDILKAEKLDVNTYTFSDLEGEKLYKIKLVAKNEFDKSVESILELTTSDYADPDFTLSQESVTQDGAKITWESTESEKLTYRVLLNGLEVAKGLEVLEYEFKGLSFNVKYTATVEATNEHGKVKTKSFEFKTLDADGPADFKIFVENISHESALVRWETTGDKNVILSYRVFVNKFYQGEAFNDNEILLSRLEADKLYQIKIEVKNAENKTFEKTKEFRTLAAPSLSGFTISANEIKATTALLSWTESIASDGSKVTYDVYYENGAKAKSGLEKREFQLEGLQADKNYEYKVEARCVSVIFPLTQTVSFTTKSYEIPGDFELNVQDITRSQAKVSWTNSELPSGGAITYEAYLDGQACSYDASGNAYIYKNLNAGTKYKARIVAKSQNNTTNEKTIDFTTEAEGIPVVTIDVVSVKKRSIELNWNLTEMAYNDRFKLFLNGLEKLVSSDRHYTLNNLQSNTNYKVKLVATRRGVDYEKEIDVKTLAYPEAIDFNMVIDAKSYSHVEVDLNDFTTKNSAQFDDLTNMTFEANVNGVKTNWGKAVTSKTLTGLSEQTHYDFKLTIRHADGSIALEKSTEFTTPANEAPVWNDDLKIKATGFSFLELENNFATDPENSSMNYTYYVNGKALQNIIYGPNGRGDGEIDKGANTNGESILLKHLISNRDYTFYVKAIDALGKESISNTVSFKTAPDAKKMFELRAAIDPSVKHVGPYWMKMGEKASIKEIRVKWLIDGILLGDRGEFVDISRLIENGDQYSLDLDYSPILNVKPDAKISFTISIEWVDKEAFIGNSESSTIVVIE